MMMEHDTTVWFAKSFGLFYLVAMSIAVVLYAYWPSNKKQFDSAAQSILGHDDKPSLDRPGEDASWR
jgi:cytochrome c oxidase cbb3-type subunit 4